MSDAELPQTPGEYYEFQGVMFRNVMIGGQPLFMRDVHINNDFLLDTMSPDTQVGHFKDQVFRFGLTDYEVRVSTFNESLGAIKDEDKSSARLGVVEISSPKITADQTVSSGVVHIDIAAMGNGTIFASGELMDPDDKYHSYEQDQYDEALRLLETLGMPSDDLRPDTRFGSKYRDISTYLNPKATTKVTEFLKSLS